MSLVCGKGLAILYVTHNLGGEGGADGTGLDVGEDDGGTGALGLDIGGLTRGRRAGSTRDTRGGRVGVGGVVAVEPEHLRLMVVPDGHDEDHAFFEGVAHRGETAHLLEGVGVAEGGLLRVAKVVGDGVEGVHARDLRLRVGDDLAVLDVEAADLREIARGRVVGGDELGDDGELGRGVDGFAGAQEGLVAHAPRVEVAAVLVADTVVTVVTVAAVGAFAAGLARDGADVGCNGGTHRVRLPDVHLVTARSVVTGSCVRVVGRACPIEDVGLDTYKVNLPSLAPC